VILDELLIAKATEALMPALSVLMDADSFAFFESTIGIFIEFKALKNSPEWIWERVCNNVRRLRPEMRHKAKEAILALPKRLRLKMAVDEQELSVLCGEGGGESLSGSLRFDLTASPSKSMSKSPIIVQEEQEEEDVVVVSSSEEVMHSEDSQPFDGK